MIYLGAGYVGVGALVGAMLWATEKRYRVGNRIPLPAWVVLGQLWGPAALGLAAYALWDPRGTR